MEIKIEIHRFLNSQIPGLPKIGLKVWSHNWTVRSWEQEGVLAQHMVLHALLGALSLQSMLQSPLLGCG